MNCDRLFGEYDQVVPVAYYDNVATAPSMNDIITRCEAMSEEVGAKYEFFCISSLGLNI